MSKHIKHFSASAKELNIKLEHNLKKVSDILTLCIGDYGDYHW